MLDCTVNQQQMKKRTKQYFAHISELCEVFTDQSERSQIRTELLRAGSSIAANYRAACHAPSRADFISRLSVVLKETDKSLYLLELLLEPEQVHSNVTKSLMKEGNQIVSILVFSISSALRPVKGFQSVRAALTA